MTLGLDNKRNLIVLAITLAVLGYVVYTNLFTGPSATPAPAPTASQQVAAGAEEPVIAAPSGPAPAARVQTKGNRATEFHPVLRSKRVEDRIDPMKVDPTLHLEVLAKLQDAAAETGGRNLFQFGQAPAPQAKTAAKVTAPEPIVIPQPRPASPQAPVTPPPAPIPLKYYGVSTTRADGRKTAFFLDGDQILMGAEGDIVGKRYRVVRIGVNSVVVEDTQEKRQQPLPLEENANIPG